MSSLCRIIGSLGFCLVVVFAQPAALAQQSGQAQQPDQAKLREEMRAAVSAAAAAAKLGPAGVELGAQAKFSLPAQFSFIPAAEAARVMRAMGNVPGDTFLGMVMGAKPFEDDWFAVLRYTPSGYIKDEDAKDWNANELLESLKEGTEESNADRRARGIPEMEITGWIEPPRYDAATHRLVWSAGVRDKGTAPQGDLTVNYNTYVLGREGYLSMNLVTTSALVEGQKPMARDLLAAIGFYEGKRYGDFNASTDRVAEYGLAALVGGVAAKKLGLFGVIAALLVKFWKVIAIAVAAGGAGIFKIFRRRKTEA